MKKLCRFPADPGSAESPEPPLDPPLTILEHPRLHPLPYVDVNADSNGNLGVKTASAFMVRFTTRLHNVVGNASVTAQGSTSLWKLSKCDQCPST